VGIEAIGVGLVEHNDGCAPVVFKREFLTSRMTVSRNGGEKQKFPNVEET
jgi:hypothetical protein